MFGKLLKHDFKAVLGEAIPLIISALVASVIGGLSINLLDSVNMENNDVIGVFIILATFLSYLVVIIAPLGFQVIIYYHFYKNLFTDEGYLTFTLPVKRSSILLSKTLNAMIWTALSLVISFVLIIVSLICAGASKAVGDLFLSIFSIFKGASFEEVLWFLIYAIEVLLIAVAFTAMMINLIQFCITFGATLAKKHKLLAAFGILYAVNAVLSFSAQIIAIIATDSLSTLFSDILNADPLLYLLVILLILFAIFIILAAVAVAFYTLSLRRIKYHLNIS